MTTRNPGEKIITPEFIASYPVLFEPKADDRGELFYSVALVFPAGTDLEALKADAMAVGKAKWGAKYVPGPSFHFPFRTDAEAKGYPEGSTFFSAKTKSKPGIVSRYAGPDGKPQVITDPEAIYPGVILRASIRFYAFESDKKKGVGVQLNNLQKVRDGERMDGRMKAEDEFDADGEAPAGNDLLD